MSQLDLFDTTRDLPEGFVYRADFITPREEDALLAHIRSLTFAEFKMHGVTAKRRTAHFGFGYEFDGNELTPAPPIPEFLLALAERVGSFAGCTPSAFAEVLVTEYPPGAPIGWHRDAPPFDIIVGISLLAACTMRFRSWPHKPGAAVSKPISQQLAPRSAYIIQGASRTRWQHHIPPVKQLRYSITYRTLRRPPPRTRR